MGYGTFLARRFMKPRASAIDYSKQYLTFIAKASGTFTFTAGTAKGFVGGTIGYSTDGGETWTTSTLASGGTITTPTISAGNKVLWKASGFNPGSQTSSKIGTFSSTAQFDVEGNVMSMQDGDNYQSSTTLTYGYQFARLFYNATMLVSAKNMILPVLTMKNRCYSNMFYGCSRLTDAPALPATTVYSYCYEYMFYGCSALVKAPALNATSVSSYCYQYMFYGCTNLEVAPELPASTLSTSCYRYMFYNCTKLAYIKILATDISASNCLNNWVSGVAQKGTMIQASSATWTTRGVSGIPSAWGVKKGALRLLYQKYDYTTDGTSATLLDTGIALFDGALAGYEVDLRATLTEIPDSGYARFMACAFIPSGGGETQGIIIQAADSVDRDIQLVARPIISGRQVISTSGNGDAFECGFYGNNSKVNCYAYMDSGDYYDSISTITGTAIQTSDAHLVLGGAEGGSYTKMVISTLRVYEIDATTI